MRFGDLQDKRGSVRPRPGICLNFVEGESLRTTSNKTWNSKPGRGAPIHVGCSISAPQLLLSSALETIPRLAEQNCL
jgi:hypothetical protein